MVSSQIHSLTSTFAPSADRALAITQPSCPVRVPGLPQALRGACRGLWLIALLLAGPVNLAAQAQFESVESRTVGLPERTSRPQGVLSIESTAGECAWDQTISQEQLDAYANLNSTQGVGQSFTAPCSGRLRAVWVNVYSVEVGPIQGVLRVFEGSGGTGLTLGIAPYTLYGAGWAYLNLTEYGSYVLVEEGKTYTFLLDAPSTGSGAIGALNGDPYGGGNAFAGPDPSNLASYGADLTFQTDLPPIPCTVDDYISNCNLLDDIDALVALYYATDGPNWTNNTNWLKGSVGTWHGVTFFNPPTYEPGSTQPEDGVRVPGEQSGLEGTAIEPRVIEVNLTGNNLVGSLPASIGKLDAVGLFWLGGNPGLTGSLPTEIGTMWALKDLNIANSGLSGSIPSSMGGLPAILQIQLQGNQLTGTIPPELGSATTLIRLALAGNKLSGSIPSSLGSLTGLTFLGLDSNQLSGTIPEQLGSVNGTEALVLGNNLLTGIVPVGVATVCANSASCNLVQNGTDLCIPDTYFYQVIGEDPIGGLPLDYTCGFSAGLKSDVAILEALYDATNGDSWTNSSNWFTADVSSWHGISLANDRVTGIGLNSNNLTGQLPSEIGGLSALTGFDVGVNEINGSIPSTVGDLLNLTFAEFSANNFSGSLPSTLGKLVNLSFFSVYDNNLTGSIPAALGDMSALQLLQLGKNAIGGSIPGELGTLSALQYLYLGDNPGLGGPLPAQIGDLANLLHLEFYNTAVSGPLPGELTKLGLLNRFWFWTTSVCVPQDAPFQDWLSGVADVNGNGVDCVPLIGVDPSALAFGPVRVGTSKDLTITVSNTGTAAAQMSVFGIGEFGSDGFSFVSGAGSFTLDPDATRQVSVRFAPTQPGEIDSGIFFDFSGGGLIGEFSYPISGTGTAPSITVSPASLTFGDVQVGLTKDLTVTITNTGTAAMAGSVAEGANFGSEGFAVQSGGGAFSLDAGQSKNVVVRLASPSEGAKASTLEITHDASNAASPVSVALTGNGTAAPAASVTVSPASLEFGDIQVGQTKDLAVTISNTGNAPLSGAVEGGSGFAEAGYSIESGSGAYELAGGQSKEIVVRLAPPSEGAKASTLEITHDASNAASPVSVALSGNGFVEMVPPVAVDDTVTTQPGAPVSIAVLTNDDDPNGNGVQLVGVNVLPTKGVAVAQGDGTVLYTPFETFVEGSDSFVYQITNGTLTSTGTVVIHMASGVARDREDLPGTFALEQNYPNPFNPSTSIRYSVAEPGRVTLRIFDGVGRLVDTLVDQHQSAGTFQVVFDARNLPSGTYLYIMEHNGVRQARALVLSK